MSGTCLSKKGNRYSCDQCERKGLKADFDFCPYCGEEIIMRWDQDNDCELSAAPTLAGKEGMDDG